MPTIGPKLVREHLAATVAFMHHREGLAQTEIAERLALGRMQVSRLLELARALGFVGETPVRAPSHLETGAQLLSRLPGLRLAMVAATHEALSIQSRIEAVAGAAAALWEDQASFVPTGSVAIGGGRAMACLVERVQLPERGADYFALSNIPSGDWEVSADTNLAILKRRFAHITIHPLPAMQLSSEMPEAAIAADRLRILGLRCVQQHLDRVRDCRLVFTGVGSIADPNLKQRLTDIGLPPAQLPDTVTGDISYNLVYHEAPAFRDDCPLNKRLISVPMDTLAEMAARGDTAVVVVGWGRGKAAPVLDAYRAGVFNALVVDAELAQGIMDMLDAAYLEKLLPPTQKRQGNRRES